MMTMKVQMAKATRANEVIVTRHSNLWILLRPGIRSVIDTP